MIERTRAEGPGLRFAIWVQGCSIRCPGCFNPHFWGAHGGVAVPATDLAAQAAAAGVEGVTFLGGEPFEQARPLAMLAAAVHGAGLTVMTFTGYEREFLNGPDAPHGTRDLLSATDLLVDGRYDETKRDTVRPWVGSTNQRFHFLSDRYRYIEASLTTLPDKVEIRVAPDGQMAVNGWAGVDQLDELFDGLTPPLGRGSTR